MTIYIIKENPCYITVYDETRIQKRLDIGYNSIYTLYNVSEKDIDELNKSGKKFFVDNVSAAIEYCNKENAKKQLAQYEMVQTGEY